MAKGPARKSKPCPPGSKKSDGTKPHVTKPTNKRKKPDKPKKKPDIPFKTQKEQDRKPEKPPNKRTGEDYRDWADLRERIKKDKDSRPSRRKNLPYKI